MLGRNVENPLEDGSIRASFFHPVLNARGDVMSRDKLKPWAYFVHSFVCKSHSRTGMTRNPPPIYIDSPLKKHH